MKKALDIHHQDPSITAFDRTFAFTSPPPTSSKAQEKKDQPTTFDKMIQYITFSTLFALLTFLILSSIPSSHQLPQPAPPTPTPAPINFSLRAWTKTDVHCQILPSPGCKTDPKFDFQIETDGIICGDVVVNKTKGYTGEKYVSHIAMNSIIDIFYINPDSIQTNQYWGSLRSISNQTPAENSTESATTRRDISLQSPSQMSPALQRLTMPGSFKRRR